MNVFTIGNRIIAIICAIVLLLALWPGCVQSRIGDATAITIFLWFPLLLGLSIYTIYDFFRAFRSGWQKVKLKLIRFALALAITFLTIVLILGDIPQRVAFLPTISSFEQYLEEYSHQDSTSMTFNKRLGIWKVDQYIKDLRGGSYFRIGTADKIFCKVSYGFVYKPNKEGTPFGNTLYKLGQITKDWFYFEVTEEYCSD